MKYQLIEELRNSSNVIKEAMDKGWDIPELSEALAGASDILIDTNPSRAKQLLCEVINKLGERDLNYLISWMFVHGHIEDNDALAPVLQGYYKSMAEMFLGEEVHRRTIELLNKAQVLYDAIHRYEEGEPDLINPQLDDIIKTIEDLTGMVVEPDDKGVLRIVDPNKDLEEEE